MQKIFKKKEYRAKKSLGQNFLKSVVALKEIVKAGEISQDDIILEIGPGKGALTEKLLEKCNHVIAIEKDRELFELLKEKFTKEISAGKLIIFNEDILNFNVKSYKLESYKLIANIPYNITGAIIKKFLTEEHQPSLMVLMVQNEVAKRICVQARPRQKSKESILSISVKAYGEPKMIMKVPARYFSPAPKVDSAIIAIKNISRKNFIPLLPPPSRGGLGRGEFKNLAPNPSPYQGEGKKPHPNPLLEGEGANALEEKFWEIVHAGFAHKRKKLSSNLKKYLNYPLGKTSGVELGNIRAENLKLEDWINLAKKI